VNPNADDGTNNAVKKDWYGALEIIVQCNAGKLKWRQRKRDKRKNRYDEYNADHSTTGGCGGRRL